MTGFDDKKVEQLLDEYKDIVKAKAKLYYMLGSDEDDIIQEGMIGLFSAIQTFDESKGASFRTFADMCINRRMISAVKMANRRKHSPLNDAASLDRPLDEDASQTLSDILPAASDSNPENIVILSEMTELVMDHSSKLLSELEHQVLERMLEGKDYRTIAGELGKMPKSIDNAMQRIRSKLRRFFE